MTITEPKVTPTGRYTAVQAAKLLGLHRNTIRNLTNRGILRCEVRKSTMEKYYTGVEIMRVWNQHL